MELILWNKLINMIRYYVYIKIKILNFLIIWSCKIRVKCLRDLYSMLYM